MPAQDQSPNKPSTNKRLDDPAERAALCKLVREIGSVEGACREAGLNKSSVWVYADENEEFGKQLRKARQVVADQRYDECIAIADRTDLSPQDKHIRIETRMRVAGKARQGEYGDKPSTQVNVGVQIGTVCTEEQRARLIAMREALLGDKLNNQGRTIEIK